MTSVGTQRAGRTWIAVLEVALFPWDVADSCVVWEEPAPSTWRGSTRVGVQGRELWFEDGRQRVGGWFFLFVVERGGELKR